LDWSDDLGPAVDQIIDAGQVNSPGRRHAKPPQPRASSLAQLLPRDQVGVVLRLSDQYLVAWTNSEPAGMWPGGSRIAHRVRDEVYALGGALGEDDLAGIGSDERCDPGPRALVSVGGFLA
jgi:hypothetical protein